MDSPKVTPPESVYSRTNSQGEWMWMLVLGLAVVVLVGVVVWYLIPSGTLDNTHVVSSLGELETLLASGEVFLMAYSPSCGHCTATIPAFEAASRSSTTTFAKVDVTTATDVAKRLKVTYVPFMCRMQTLDKWTEYTGERTESALASA